MGEGIFPQSNRRRMKTMAMKYMAKSRGAQSQMEMICCSHQTGRATPVPANSTHIASQRWGAVADSHSDGERTVLRKWSTGENDNWWVALFDKPLTGFAPRIGDRTYGDSYSDGERTV